MSRTERFFRDLAWRLTYAQPGPVSIWINEHPRATALGMAVFFVASNVWCGGWD